MTTVPSDARDGVCGQGELAWPQHHCGAHKCHARRAADCLRYAVALGHDLARLCSQQVQITPLCWPAASIYRVCLDKPQQLGACITITICLLLISTRQPC
jgi:hypothetical protein